MFAFILCPFPLWVRDIRALATAHFTEGDRMAPNQHQSPKVLKSVVVGTSLPGGMYVWYVPPVPDFPTALPFFHPITVLLQGVSLNGTNVPEQAFGQGRQLWI